ncbi:MAG TPA: aspartate aminotransferase family protein [Solirubrobacterales bacterium]|nr:aspartate aminotransferase family protein [Solirubrobacterales bacterium]
MTVETGTTSTPAVDRARIAQLTEQQMTKLGERTPASRDRFQRAVKVMPKGVPSSFQENDPWPIYVERGEGTRVWDVDGNEYVDFHNGFGVMCVGHANPSVGTAVKARVDLGTHFAAPTDGSIVVAEELTRRFGLPQWRFTNSGTESTMDAVHLARGATGRDVILKIEGSYHGHHDAVMVSVYPALEDLGERDDPRSVPYGAGYPRALTELTRAVPFNDAAALESALEKLEGRVAGLIMEPAMMNINIIPPVEGYLERVRELCTEHGVKLIFDEVKTGATISYGGATRRFGVTPDLITLAKAICGGYPGGAIGMTEEIAELVASGAVHQYGTFNGNPLVMAAAQAALTEVLTDDAYAKLERTNEALKAACREVIDRYGLPAYAEGIGAKGCVIFAAEPLREYRDYLTKVDGELSTLAWLYHMNNGIFMTPGVEEEWTLSIAHTDDDLDRYLTAFETFARELTGS